MNIFNVPNLRFPEFEGEWEEKTLGNVAEIIGGGTPNTAIDEYWNGDIQWFTPSEIKSNYVSKSQRTITELGLNKSSAKLLPVGAILITTRATIGEVAITTEACSTNQGFQSLVVNKNINNLFISNWIKQNRSELIRRAKGSTFAEISKSEIEQMLIQLPSELPEQDKIASFFWSLDQRIETQIKIIDKYESLIKGLSESLFSHKLGFKQFEQSWEMKYGNEIFENISDKNHYSNFPILAITQEYGAIPRDLIDYNVAVTDKSLENYKVVQIGDFIISLRSFQGGIEYSYYKGICSPAYIVLRPIIPINRTFYKHYLKTSDYITELNKNIEGIRDGKMISYKQFSEIPLPYPVIAEQNKIANVLSVVEAKLKQEKMLLKKYSEQKKFFLQNMLI